MESKTWYLSSDKIENEIEIRSHFGWELLAKTSSSLTMKREKTDNVKRLARLEKQYSILKRRVPLAGIIYSVLGVILALVSLAFPKSNTLFWVFLLIGGVALVIGIGMIFTFLIMLPYKKKMIKELFDEGDQLLGKRKVLPLPVNIAKPDKDSFHIKKAIYDGELDIRY